MLRKSLILICLSFFVSTVKLKAQGSAYSETFSVTDSEIKYKVCPFDKDASAVVFLDDAVSTYNDDYNLVTYHHIKLKILNDKGLDYGNVSIPFYSDGDFENITNVDGTVYNYDGTLTSKKIDKNSIYTKKENQYWSEVRFAFPDIKAGSIIDYYYTSIKKNYGGLKEWVFQKEIPVIKSKYLLTILPDAEFSYAVQKSPDMPIQIKPNKLEGQISFEMNDIPGLRNEKYIDSKNDYLQKVSFQLSKFQDENYMTSWSRVDYEMARDADFYGQLKKSLDGTDDFIKKISQDSSDLDKMKKVFSYVQDNMLWNNIYSKYTPDGVKKAWDKKSGTSGDINLILVNLLRQAGLDAEPMLVSTRSNGKVNPNVTMIDQFNTVYACVSIKNKRYYLDASNKFNSYKLTPYPILNTTAFLITRKNGTLINIADSLSWYREEINIDGSVNGNGIMKGSFSMKSYDYAREYWLRNLSTNSNSENQALITGDIPGLNLSDLKTENKDNDSLALTTKSDFTFPLNQNGDYYLFPVNILSGLNENPFLADRRFSNIDFGYKQLVAVLFHIKYDTSFVADALPKGIKLTDSEGDLFFIRNVMNDQQDHELLISSTFEIKHSLYPADQYAVIKNYYKKLFDLLNEQIVLKKK